MLDGCKKKAHRILADLAATYGSGVLPDPLPHDVRCGLFMNLERIWLRGGVAVANGTVASFDPAPLPLEWFDAAVLMPGQAAAAKYASDIAKAKAMARAAASGMSRSAFGVI